MELLYMSQQDNAICMTDAVLVQTTIVFLNAAASRWHLACICSASVYSPAASRSTVHVQIRLQWHQQLTAKDISFKSALFSANLQACMGMLA